MRSNSGIVGICLCGRAEGALWNGFNGGARKWDRGRQTRKGKWAAVGIEWGMSAEEEDIV